MPLEADDQARVDDAIRESQADPNANRVLVLDTEDSQKLGPFTVICTMWNRTIGSGIFIAPAIVLRSTNSVGASLLLWALGCVIGMSALLVWLELGLSIPKFELADRDENGNAGQTTSLQCVPRNGGEKNYLEHIYKSPRLRTTCTFGFIYVVLGNLAGNALAIGNYILQAAGVESNDPLARGIAVLALTFAVLLHAAWRRGGIVISNALAVLKVLILGAIIIIGFAASAGASFGHRPVHGETVDPDTGAKTSNFSTKSSFSSASDEVSSYASALLFIAFTFSGYEQPFYVLSEVYRPKKNFAKSTLAGQGFLCILFMLVNIAYLCVVSVDEGLDAELDMATVFFREVFGNELAPRVMSGIIALSVFGNIVVMTFTAARVKQELAKEGILPFSLWFAKSSTTPWARLRSRFFPYKQSRREPEQSPSASLFLHWFFSMVMIAATASTSVDTAYTVLASLYSYVIILLLGLFTSGGLLYLRFFSSERHEWVALCGFKPWGGPTAAIIYTAVCAFLLVARFIPPSSDSAYSTARTGISSYVIPAAGLASLALGIAYYVVFMYIYPPLFKDGKKLVVDREATIVREHGEYVQALEIVDASWERKSGPGSNEVELQRVSVVAR